MKVSSSRSRVGWSFRYHAFMLLSGLCFATFFLILIHLATFSDPTPSVYAMRRPSPVAPIIPFSALLIRSIGNALPPRHSSNQTLANLQFILQYEPEHDTLQTHWLLNRIQDKTIHTQIEVLLKSYSQNYTIIDLDWETYANTRHNLQVKIQKDIPPVPPVYGEWAQLEAVSAVHDDKIKAGIAINSVRNIMLKKGKESGARWILPWDQNCFLNEAGFLDLKKQVEEQKERKYHFTFMIRNVHPNMELIKNELYANKPQELLGEPQIIFRNDSREEFDTRLRYGRRDKAALLVRLHLHGIWDTWGWDNYERSIIHRNKSNDITELDANSAGWVIRLNSGKPALEATAAAYVRETKRFAGIILFLNTLDNYVWKNLYSLDKNALQLYNKSTLEQVRRDTSSSTNTSRLPPPPPDVVVTILNNISNDSFVNTTSILPLLNYTTTTTLAWYFTRNKSFAEKAMQGLHNLMISSEWKTITPIVLFPKILSFLDTLRLLKISSSFTNETEVDAWINTLLIQYEGNEIMTGKIISSTLLDCYKVHIVFYTLSSFIGDIKRLSFHSDVLQNLLELSGKEQYKNTLLLQTTLLAYTILPSHIQSFHHYNICHLISISCDTIPSDSIQVQPVSFCPVKYKFKAPSLFISYPSLWKNRV